MAVRLAHGLQNRRVIAARGVLPLLNYTSLRTSGSKHVTSARFDVLLRCGERPEVWSASAWTTTPSPASWMISTMGSGSRCELLQGKEPAGCGKGGGAWPLDFHPWNHCKLWFTAGVLNPLPNVCVLNPLQEPPIRSMEPPRLPRAVLLAGVVWRGPPCNACSDACRVVSAPLARDAVAFNQKGQLGFRKNDVFLGG